MLGAATLAELAATLRQGHGLAPSTTSPPSPRGCRCQRSMPCRLATIAPRSPTATAFCCWRSKVSLNEFVARDPWFARPGAARWSTFPMSRPWAAGRSPSSTRSGLRARRGRRQCSTACAPPRRPTACRSSAATPMLAPIAASLPLRSWAAPSVCSTSFDARPADRLIAAIDLRGRYREPFSNWEAVTEAPAARLRGDLEILPALARGRTGDGRQGYFPGRADRHRDDVRGMLEGSAHRLKLIACRGRTMCRLSAGCRLFRASAFWSRRDARTRPAFWRISATSDIAAADIGAFTADHRCDELPRARRGNDLGFCAGTAARLRQIRGVRMTPRAARRHHGAFDQPARRGGGTRSNSATRSPRLGHDVTVFAPDTTGAGFFATRCAGRHRCRRRRSVATLGHGGNTRRRICPLLRTSGAARLRRLARAGRHFRQRARHPQGARSHCRFCPHRAPYRSLRK